MWTKTRLLLKPDDQLDLTEAELNEEIPKVLTSDNPNIKKNLVIYSFKEGQYIYVCIIICNKISILLIKINLRHLQQRIL